MNKSVKNNRQNSRSSSRIGNGFLKLCIDIKEFQFPKFGYVILIYILLANIAKLSVKFYGANSTIIGILFLICIGICFKLTFKDSKSYIEIITFVTIHSILYGFSTRSFPLFFFVTIITTYIGVFIGKYLARFFRTIFIKKTKK